MISKLLVIIIMVMSLEYANANSNNSFVDIAAGYPYDLSIENPDATKAYYDGFSFKLQYNYALGGSRNNFSYGLTFHYKYLNLENTKQGTTNETARHKGLGVGGFIKNGGFYLGVNYSIMKAEHQTSGMVYGLDNFDYFPLTAEVSYTIPYGSSLEVGPAITYSTTDLSKKETGLSKDAPYNEQIAWFKIIFYLDRF